MSHDAHAHAHHGPDHVPHVSPLSLYLKTFATLMVLTGITVGASLVNLGTSVNLLIALLIATIKASIVAAFFMHLATDQRFNALIFASSIVFLIIFVSFTAFDTMARGMFDPAKRDRPAIMTDPFAAAPTASAAASAAPAAAGSGAPAAASAKPTAAPK